MATSQDKVEPLPLTSVKTFFFDVSHVNLYNVGVLIPTGTGWLRRERLWLCNYRPPEVNYSYLCLVPPIWTTQAAPIRLPLSLSLCLSPGPAPNTSTSQTTTLTHSCSAPDGPLVFSLSLLSSVFTVVPPRLPQPVDHNLKETVAWKMFSSEAIKAQKH